MEAELLASRFEMDELLSRIHSNLRQDSDPQKAKAGRRLAVRLLVGGMDGAAGEQSSDATAVSEPRPARRMHKSASEVNVAGSGSRGGHVSSGSMGPVRGSGKSLNGSAMKAQLRAEREELAYLRMEAERIESSGVIDIVNDDGDGFPSHLSWQYRGLDITPKGAHAAAGPADGRESGAEAESVLASWVRERRELEAQVSVLKAELKRRDKELKAAGKAKAAASRELDAVWGQVGALEGQLHDLQDEKSALEKEIDGLRSLHLSTARAAEPAAQSDSAGARAADTEMVGMLKMVGDFSRRLALADDAVRRAEAKNHELSERLRASEGELRETREALRTAQEERDALAAEMKEALDTWAWSGGAHPAPSATRHGRTGSSGSSSSSGGMGVSSGSTGSWVAGDAGQGGGGQQWQQRGWDIGGGGKSPKGDFSGGFNVSRPPRDPKSRQVHFDSLSCSPSPP